MTPLDGFDRVLAALHRATLDDAQWPAASALIDEVCGTAGNALAVGEVAGGDGRVYFAGFYLRGERRPELEREYFNVYYPHDERLPRLRLQPEGTLVHVPDLYSEAERRTSFVYNEGLPRLGSQNGLNARFDGPDGLRIVWASGDPAGTGVWQSAQTERIEALLPHIRQFVAARQALASADALGGGLADLLDNRLIGVLHLDRGGRLLAANAPALELLRRADGLFDRGGALRAALPADEDRLQRLLARALPGRRFPAAGSMTLQRPLGAAGLVLHISPLDGAQADFRGGRAAALVLVVDLARRPRIDPAWVSEGLGLTPSEGRAAALLAEGRSVGEIAAEAGLRQSYVRLILKAIYKKLGLSGQVALAQRVLAMEVLPRR